MPICPRCGKCLSSDQALTYHLNRKYRCGTWKCTKCNEILNTKFQLQMHEMSCFSDNESIMPTTDFLMDLYNNLPFVVMQVDNNNIIKNISPNVKKLHHIDVKDLRNKSLDSLRFNDKSFKVNRLHSNNNESIIALSSL